MSDRNAEFNTYITKLCYVLGNLHFVKRADASGPVSTKSPTLTSQESRAAPLSQQISLNIEEYPISESAFEQELDNRLEPNLRSLNGGVPHVNVVSFDGFGPNASAVIEVYWKSDES